MDGSRPTDNIQRQVYDGFVPVPGPVTADKYRFNVFPAVPGSNGVEQGNIFSMASKPIKIRWIRTGSKLY